MTDWLAVIGSVEADQASSFAAEIAAADVTVGSRSTAAGIGMSTVLAAAVEPEAVDPGTADYMAIDSGIVDRIAGTEIRSQGACSRRNLVGCLVYPFVAGRTNVHSADLTPNVHRSKTALGLKTLRDEGKQA